MKISKAIIKMGLLLCVIISIILNLIIYTYIKLNKYKLTQEAQLLNSPLIEFKEVYISNTLLSEGNLRAPYFLIYPLHFQRMFEEMVEMDSNTLTRCLIIQNNSLYAFNQIYLRFSLHTYTPVLYLFTPNNSHKYLKTIHQMHQHNHIRVKLLHVTLDINKDKIDDKLYLELKDVINNTNLFYYGDYYRQEIRFDIEIKMPALSEIVIPLHAPNNSLLEATLYPLYLHKNKAENGYRINIKYDDSCYKKIIKPMTEVTGNE